MKFIKYIFTFIFSSCILYSQNYTIATATLVTSQDITFNNNVAQANEDLDCIGNLRKVVYKFETTTAGTLNVTVTPQVGSGTLLYESSNGLSATGDSQIAIVDCNTDLYSHVTAANTAYYLVVHSSDATQFNVRIQSTQPLPVELTNFTSQFFESSITLAWETATEINNYGFEIERASFHKDGTSPFQEWKTIGFVEGHGNSNSPKNYSFIDNYLPSDLQPSDELEYRLKQIDTDGSFKYYSTTTKVDLSSITSINSSNLPIEFSLSQNYPNPFNPSTVISYSIAAPSIVKLSIFNLQGKKITSLVNDFKEAGNYKINYDASILSSGVYFYELKAISEQNNILFRDNKKMILIK